VLGLVVRRQANLWVTWRPWAVAALLVVPAHTSSSSAITFWLYLNNWDSSLLGLPAFRHDIPKFLLAVPLNGYIVLGCWSWVSGFLVGTASGRALPSIAVLFCSFVAFVQVIGPQIFFWVANNDHPNGPVFALLFYRVILPVIVCLLLVLLPALVGMRHGARLRQLSGISRLVLWTVALLSSALMASQVAFIYRVLLRFLAPAFLLPAFDWPFQLHFLVYWPILYWVAATFQRRRKMRIA
jgi:hypothetical protein